MNNPETLKVGDKVRWIATDDSVRGDARLGEVTETKSGTVTIIWGDGIQSIDMRTTNRDGWWNDVERV